MSNRMYCLNSDRFYSICNIKYSQFKLPTEKDITNEINELERVDHISAINKLKLSFKSSNPELKFSNEIFNL